MRDCEETEDRGQLWELENSEKAKGHDPLRCFSSREFFMPCNAMQVRQKGMRCQSQKMSPPPANYFVLSNATWQN